jgi:hypothetical protein
MKATANATANTISVLLIERTPDPGADWNIA